MLREYQFAWLIQSVFNVRLSVVTLREGDGKLENIELKVPRVPYFLF
jgi:hypothetical protein